MITLTREEAQQVLDALGSCGEDWIYDGEDEHPVDVYDKEKVGNAFVLLKNRLAQPEPEPVAWLEPEWGERICPEVGYEVTITADHPKDLCWIPLYPAPPQRDWQGLTDEEMNAAMDYWSDPVRSAYGGAHSADGEYVGMIDTWRYIEAKLKEKNGG
jgi:hypothetical protein